MTDVASPDVAVVQESAAMEYDVLIVGAGFSGIYQLYHLRKLGFSVKLLEAGGDIGGIWHWNCYPGARVDTHVPLYEYSDEELWRDWDWSERFPSGYELRRYFNYVDKKWDIRKDCQFNARIEVATFDTDSRKWHLTTTNGEKFVTRFFLLCAGFAAKPYIPKIEGLDSFEGIMSHTGLWPQDGINFTNRKVGVIGTGASAIQVIQEASKVATHVTVFQRTACYALPMFQKRLDLVTQAKEKEQYAEIYARRRDTFAGFEYDFLPYGAFDVTSEERKAVYENLYNAGGFSYWLSTFNDVLFDMKANATAYEFWRDKTRARIKDPKIAEILAPEVPPYPFGTKRPSLENGFYEVFSQDNVSLVDLRKTPIVKVTPKGVVTSEGETELDILVLGTGFDAVSGGILNIDIRGVDGAKISDRWNDGVEAFLGLTTAGFPNLFFVYGPQSPSGFLNGPTSAEMQGDVVIQCLKYLRAHDLTWIESKEETDRAWSDETNELANMTLFPRAESWYMGANIPGKKRQLLNYPGGLPLYLEKCEAVASKGYSDFVLK